MPAKVYDSFHQASNIQNDKADDYDYCLVLPVVSFENNQEQLSKEALKCITTLRLLKFELFPYKALSVRDDGLTDEIFVLLRAPYDKLREFADQIANKMLLDPEVLQQLVERGNEAENIKGFKIAHRPDVVKYQPYEYIYGEFSMKLPYELYWKEQGDENPFRDYERLKLTSLLLESKPPGGYDPLDIAKLLKTEVIKGCFPLTNRGKSKYLFEEWLDMYKLPWQSPFYHVREYFGEKVGLYFVFLGHYSLWLCIPAFIGIPFQLAVIITGDFSLSAIPAYSFILAIWAVFMLEFWKRKQSKTVLQWGTANFESEEITRLEFKGEEIDSYINGKKIKFFSNKKRDQIILTSYVIVFILIFIDMAILASIYVIRFALIKNGVSKSNSQTIASIANAVQIKITDAIYKNLAVRLTNFENHRTDTLYEDSFIIKIFLFQFINSYASFYYLAFLAEFFGDCERNECVVALSQNLGIILGSALITNVLFEVILPFFSYKYKLHKEHDEEIKANKLITRPEKEFLLAEYDHLLDSIKEYSEIAIQFGYTAIFASALPAAAFFTFVSNYIQNKSDAWKLLSLYQRPQILGAQDIGTWQSIFYLIAVAAVVTNAAITVFTQTVFDSYSTEIRLWIFIIFQWVCFSSQIFVMFVIPDEDVEVTIQKQRTDYIVSKVIEKIADDDIEIEMPKDFVDPPLVYETYPGLQLSNAKQINEINPVDNFTAINKDDRIKSNNDNNNSNKNENDMNV